MDLKETEVREDLDKLIAIIEAIKDKYGNKFGIIISAGCDIGDNWAGMCMLGGTDKILHSNFHAFLDSKKFIYGMFETINCVISHNDQDKPQLLRALRENTLNSMADLLYRCSKEGQKEAIDEAVKKVLKEAGFTN